MATQLGEAFVPIRATLDKLDADLEGARSKVEGAMGRISQAAKGVGEGLRTVGTLALTGIGAIGAAALGAAAGIAALAANAEPLVGLQAGFAATTDKIGVSAGAMLKSLQDASNGLISNRDLMTSFNKASALVGIDFGKRLPEAMSLVGKASRATGQDMGFLLDSLVTGIGRVSPMILDNLGIQVKLSDVTERAAKMFGKSAEELSKTEQQAALTDIVMEKLSATYGTVPDVSMPFAKAKTMAANFRDELGLKLLPAIAPVAEAMIGLAQKVLPILTGVLDDNVIPAIMSVTSAVAPVVEAIGELFTRISEGTDPLTAFQVMMMQLLPHELFGQFMDLISDIQIFIGQVMSVVKPIVDWVSNTVSLQDILIGLGVAIATVVIPVIVSIVSSIAPVIAAFLLVVATVALLRTAWESDFLGIRTAITDVWNKFVLPIFTQLRDWASVNLPIALKALSDFWTNVLKPAIESVWAWLNGVLVPFFKDVLEVWLWTNTRTLRVLADFWTGTLWPAIKIVQAWMMTVLLPFIRDQLIPWISERATAALQTLSNFWNKTLLPAVRDVWKFFNDFILPIIKNVIDIATVLGQIVGITLKNYWQESLLPALKKVAAYFDGKILPILNDVKDFIEKEIGPRIQWFTDHVIKPLATAIGTGLKQALQWVIDKLNELLGKLLEFKDKLQGVPIMGQSPSPLEISVRGIGSAIDELGAKLDGVASRQLPSFAAKFVRQDMEAGEPAVSSYSSTTNVYTNRDPMRVLRASRHLDKLGAMT